MRAFLLAFLAVLSGLPLSADIAWQTDRMAPGSVLVMEDDAGGVLSHVARGVEEGLFRFDMYRSQDSGLVYAGSDFTNERGEVVRSLSATGQVTRYAPHRCARTLGLCSYVILHSDGFREQRRRATWETPLGLAWTEWGLDGGVTTGALELDAFGAALSGWRRDHRSGDEIRSRRLLLALH